MQQRVAVGRGFGGIGDADFAAGAGLVLDHEALTQRALQDFRFVPRHDVGRSAGRERHDDGHRPARITVGGHGVPRRTANQRAQDGCKCDGPRASHAFFPVLTLDPCSIG